jgi:hypothetical protein
MKLPDWVFRRLEIVYLGERDRRRKEDRRNLDLDEQVMRAYYDELRAAHKAGTCGGASAGCCYVPCVPKVTSW